MNSKQFYLRQTLVFLVILILMGGGYLIYSSFKVPKEPALSFIDCVKAGYPVMESYPRRCRTPEGRTYVEKIAGEITYKNASADLIVVDLPFAGAVVGKEFTVVGQARGGWFFEASFPVELLDGNGAQLAVGIAQSEGEWMTEQFVPFKALIKAPISYIGPATLVLKKDNPSGLPENDGSISFPITVEY